MKRLPIQFRKNINQYDVDINNDKLKVSVVNDVCLIDEYLSELKKLLKDQSRVVGLDCKRRAANPQVSLLIMCVSNRCLIIQCDLINVSKSLTDFFDDESIPFVGMETNFSVKSQENINIGFVSVIETGNYSFNSGVKLGDLASRVFKKPELLKSGIVELAGLVDLKTNKTSKFGSQSGTNTSTSTSTTTQVYSVEQVKEIVHDAYYSYLIASKLMEMP